MTPPNVVDGTGTRRRIEALHAIGWTAVALAPDLGIPVTTARSRVNQWRYANRVTAGTRDLVTEVYQRRRNTPGPSARARLLAARAGCLPPNRWDGHNIDDPAADPTALPEDDDEQAAAA